MAIINTLRLRNILVRGEIAREEPAEEFVEALDDEFAALQESVVSTDSQEASESRVLASIEGLRREMAQAEARRAQEAERQADAAAKRDRQIHNHITIGIGLMIGAITVATAIISIVIVVLD